MLLTEWQEGQLKSCSTGSNGSCVIGVIVWEPSYMESLWLKQTREITLVLILVTSCYSNVGIRAYYPSPKIAFSLEDWAPPNTWFLGLPSPHPKWHPDQFSHFCRACSCVRQTYSHTDHATTVVIGHILYYAQRCGLIVESASGENCFSCHLSAQKWSRTQCQTHRQAYVCGFLITKAWGNRKIIVIFQYFRNQTCLNFLMQV